VRLRPGQFTRTDTPLHIIQEAIDNAVDEAIAGFATRLAVTVHADHSATVVDDGRGIPVGAHPVEEFLSWQAIFTVLYSGGKFDKTSGAAAYTYAGGLHGVGVSVTNALSKRLECEVRRDASCTASCSRTATSPKSSRARARPRITARRCASGPIPNTSIHPSFRSTSSRASCGRRPCCCRDSKSRSASNRAPAAFDAKLALRRRLVGLPRRARAGRTCIGAHLRGQQLRGRSRRHLCRGRGCRMGVQLVRRAKGEGEASSTSFPPRSAARTSRACARPSSAPSRPSSITTASCEGAQAPAR